MSDSKASEEQGGGSAAARVLARARARRRAQGATLQRAESSPRTKRPTAAVSLADDVGESKADEKLGTGEVDGDVGDLEGGELMKDVDVGDADEMFISPGGVGGLAMETHYIDWERPRELDADRVSVLRPRLVHHVDIAPDYDRELALQPELDYPVPTAPGRELPPGRAEAIRAALARGGYAVPDARSSAAAVPVWEGLSWVGASGLVAGPRLSGEESWDGVQAAFAEEETRVRLLAEALTRGLASTHHEAPEGLPQRGAGLGGDAAGDAPLGGSEGAAHKKISDQPNPPSSSDIESGPLATPAGWRAWLTGQGYADGVAVPRGPWVAYSNLVREAVRRSRRLVRRDLYGPYYGTSSQNTVLSGGGLSTSQNNTVPTSQNIPTSKSSERERIIDSLVGHVLASGMKRTVAEWGLHQLGQVEENELAWEVDDAGVHVGDDVDLGPVARLDVDDAGKRVSEEDRKRLRVGIRAPLQCPAGEVSLRESPRASELAVRVGRIRFFDHPLFCEEDVHASAVRSLHAELAARLGSNVIGGLDARILAIVPDIEGAVQNGNQWYNDLSRPPSSWLAAPKRTSRKEHFEGEDHPSSSSSTTKKQDEQGSRRPSWAKDDGVTLVQRARMALALLKERQDEWLYQSGVLTSLYRRWLALKDARARQGFAATPIALKLAAARPTPQSSSTNNSNNNLGGVSAQGSSSESDGWGSVGPPGRANVRALRAVAELVGAAMGAAGPSGRSRLRGLAEGILTRLWESSRGTAPPEERGGVFGDGVAYVPLLSESHPLSPSSMCPLPERRRRQQVARSRLRARVLVNGQPLLQSTPVALSWPSFSADVGLAASVRLFRRPVSIEVVLSEVAPAPFSAAPLLWPDRPLAGVLVPVPGASAGSRAVNTAGIGETSGAFRFARSLPMEAGEMAWRLDSDGADRSSGGDRASSASAAAAAAAGGIVGGPDAKVDARVRAASDRRTQGAVAVWAGWTAGALPARALSLAEDARSGKQWVRGAAGDPVTMQLGAAASAVGGAAGLGVASAADAGGQIGRAGPGRMRLAAMHDALAGGGPLAAAAAARARTLQTLENEDQNDESTDLDLRQQRLQADVAALAPLSSSIDPNDPRNSLALASLDASAVRSTAAPTDSRALGLVTDGKAPKLLPPSSSRAASASKTSSNVVAPVGGAMQRRQDWDGVVRFAGGGQGSGFRGDSEVSDAPFAPGSLRGLVRHRALAERLRFHGIPPHALGAVLAAAGGGASRLRRVSTAAIAAVLQRYALDMGRVRHRLLRLRSERPDLFTRPIPLRDEDILRDARLGGLLATIERGTPADVTRLVRGRAGDASSGAGLAAGTAAALQSAAAERVGAYLDVVRAARSRTAAQRGQRAVRLSSVVKDVALPTLAAVTDWSGILDLLAPRRPLRPRTAKTVLPRPVARAATERYEVAVHVVRVRNTPVRSVSSADAANLNNSTAASSQPGQLFGGVGTRDGAMAGEAVEDVLPALELRYRSRVTRSSARAGASAQWNEVLRLPLDLGGGNLVSGREGLRSLRDSVVLSLHDEVIVRSRPDAGAHRSTIERHDLRYLGAVHIPFPALVKHGRIEGEFRLRSPPALLGYQSLTQVNAQRATTYAQTGIGGAAGFGGATGTDIRGGVGGGGQFSGGGGIGGGGQFSGSGGVGGIGGIGGAAADQESSGPFAGNVITAAQSADTATWVYLAATIEPAPEPDSDDEDGEGAASAVEGHLGEIDALLAEMEGDATGRLAAGARTFEAAAMDGAGPDGTGGTASGGSGREHIRTMIRARTWARGLATKFPKRNVPTVVLDPRREPRLVCEYLSPLPPPPLPGADDSMRRRRHRDWTRQKNADAEDDINDEDNNNNNNGTTPKSPSSKKRQKKHVADEISVEEYNDPSVPRLTTPEALTRFVSLLPFLSDWDTFGRDGEVWATASDCLKMGAGDWEEHAVLLHNYLLWARERADAGAADGLGGGFGGGAPRHAMDVRREESGVGAVEGGGARDLAAAVRGNAAAAAARLRGWTFGLVTGRALPEGDMTWVFWQSPDQGMSVVINPCTAEAYDVRLDECPLRDIGAIIVRDNIYANVQPLDSPADMSFKLQDRTSWEPLFRPNLGDKPNIPVYQPIITYTPPLRLEAARLQAEIEEQVRARIQQWRAARSRATYFRRHLAGKLRTFLEELEARSMAIGASVGVAEGWRAGGPGNGTDLAREHIQRMTRQIVRNDVSGFPLHFSFSSLDAILHAVRATGIHENEDAHVAFALGCSVTPYPNNVMSVWVYLMALIPT